MMMKRVLLPGLCHMKTLLRNELGCCSYLPEMSVNTSVRFDAKTGGAVNALQEIRQLANATALFH